MRLATAARIGLAAVGLSPFLLPLSRAALPLGELGALLDAAFVVACHRLPERSLALAGVTMPVCSRCAGIFAGVAIGVLIALPRLSPQAWRWAIIASAAPMLIHVITQDLGAHAVAHAARIATGVPFGYALGAAAITWIARRYA